MTTNYPGIKDLIEMGLNAEEIALLYGIHSRTIKREAKKLGIALKIGHPAKSPKLSQKEKETVYRLAMETDYTLTKVVRATGLNARSIYRFLEEIDSKDWNRNRCLQCNKSFVTEKYRENKLCPECNKNNNGTYDWLGESAECHISLPE